LDVSIFRLDQATFLAIVVFQWVEARAIHRTTRFNTSRNRPDEACLCDRPKPVVRPVGKSQKEKDCYGTSENEVG